MKYALQAYSGPASRHTCPNCGKKRAFSRYIDLETQEIIDDQVGRCNREVECGYHYPPKQFFLDNPSAKQVNIGAPKTLSSKKVAPRDQLQSPSYIPMDIVERSLNCKRNNFVVFLSKRFGSDAAELAMKRFFIGTSNRWPGATVFWQADKEGRFRTGKVMLYNPENGKRVKQPVARIDWAHSILIKSGQIEPNFHMSQCLYGEHQLAYRKEREVVIVESEKTATIASLYFPQYMWMAIGGLSNLSVTRLASIKTYPIILYPDLMALAKWEEKAEELRNKGLNVTVSSMLEKSNLVSTLDKSQGLDLCDFLLRMDLPQTDLSIMLRRNPGLQDLINRLGLVVY